jgi:hypothetical protein
LRLVLLNDSTMASSVECEPIKIWDLCSDQVFRHLENDKAIENLLLYSSDILVGQRSQFRIDRPYHPEIKILFWNWKTGQLIKTFDTIDLFPLLCVLKQSNYLITEMSSEEVRKSGSFYALWNVTF